MAEESSPPRNYPEPFLAAFRDATSQLNWQVVGWRKDNVECLDETGKEQSIGLHNLYLRAQKHPPEDWKRLVIEFLQRVNVHQFEGLGDKPLEDLVEQLLVRVGQPFTPRRSGLTVWEMPLGDTGLVANLVIDYPQAMAYVNTEQIEKSGLPGEHWLEIALDNLRDRTPDDALQAIDADTGLHVCEVGDSYESSRSLILDRLLPSQSGGYLVAIPHRDLLFAMPVELRGVKQFHFLKMLANRYHPDAPYAISDEVYWVHEGIWHLFPIEMSDTNVNVIPPEEFVEVMNELDGNWTGDETEEPADDSREPPNYQTDEDEQP